MERFKLGKVGKQSQTITFKEALSQGLFEKVQRWELLYIFPPMRFPSGAIIFGALVDGESVRVKKTISADMVKELAKFLKLSKTKIVSVKVEVVFDDSGEYYLTTEEAPEGWGWVYNGQYFSYKQITEIDELAENF